MKKRHGLIKYCLVVLIFLAVTVNLSSSSSEDNIETQIKLLTYCAEEYEVGNINYAELMLCISRTREKMNVLLGAESRDYGSLLKVDEIEKALGKPTEVTRWIWVESFDGKGHEKKVSEDVAVWRKPVFDSDKISIKLEVHPSIIENKFNKRADEAPDEESAEELRRREEEIKRILGSEDQKLVYRLNFWIEFKNPEDEESLDISGNMEDIKRLAENYNTNPTEKNAEELAEQSVSIEKAFNEYYRQNPASCEALMEDIFGAENKREEQKMISWEITLHETDSCEFVLRLEMCDDCQWHGIWMNGWYECHGSNRPKDEASMNELKDPRIVEGYRNMDEAALKKETEDLIKKIKEASASEDFARVMQESQRLNTLTNAWNEKANNKDIWEQVNKEFESVYKQNERNTDRYWWVKVEQQKRQRIAELQNKIYEERKIFYQDLFSDYEKEESYYEQTQYEIRLLEDFVEHGEEMCDNNLDDNGNNQIDCDDSQCGGKFCGNLVEFVLGENGQETTTETPLYCIAGTCQAKEEIVKEEVIVCGNHICEENETVSCPQDCTQCVQHEAISCEGKVIFSGFGEDLCPLEPLCLEEKETCEKNEDCEFLCGVGECIEGECKLVDLTECKEPDCTEGDKKLENCQTGEELVTALCANGLWLETGLECQIAVESETQEVPEHSTDTVVDERTEEDESEINIEAEEVLGYECIVKTDCGNDNDVCSNGKCVTLPDVITNDEIINKDESEKEQADMNEIEEEEEVEKSGSVEGSPSVNEENEGTLVGNVIFSFFRSVGNFLFSKASITGFTTEGETFQTEETSTGSDTSETNNADSGSGSENEEDIEENSVNSEEDAREMEEREKDEREEREREEDQRRKEDQKRHENECNERCGRECYDMRVRPCAEKCIFEECGEDFDCNVDEVTAGCENRCKEDTDISSCENSCQDKCVKGEETWEEPEREEHKEWKGAFSAGGSCRMVQGKEEANLWFGGWGQEGSPFENFEQFKHKYYQGNGADWCKRDLENFLRQRSEFQKSFNQEFVVWFFEDYLGNNAKDYEEHMSGIYELYWRNIDTLREIAHRSQCIGEDEFPELELININYEAENGNGKIEFWEEYQTAKFDSIEKEIENVPTPYMKISISPPKSFIEYELKRLMENHEFPGPSGGRAKGGKTDEAPNGAREMVEKFSKDGEHVYMTIQMKDDSDIVIFNMLVILTEDAIYVESMPLEEVKEKIDFSASVPFSELFKLIEGAGDLEDYHIEHPPWGEQKKLGTTKKVKQVVDNVQMYWRFRQFMNSVEVTPKDANSEGKDLFEIILKKMMGDEDESSPSGENEDIQEKDLPEGWENPKVISGEVILEP